MLPTKDELISRARAILVDGRVRDRWKRSARATMIYPLSPADKDRNTEVVEKLKELFDAGWTE